jgi:predicted kinase
MAVHILTGPVGAGKTTYARQLESRGAVRFSSDEWMLRLYGRDLPREVQDRRLATCRRLFLDMTEELARVRVEVVLDCGFWRRSERQEARGRLARAGILVNTIHFDVPADVRWRRLEARNQAVPPDCHFITRPMFDTFESRYEPPGPDEVVRVVR